MEKANDKVGNLLGGDFRKALEGTTGRKHIDEIVKQVISSPARFDELYALTKDPNIQIAWHATWACEKLSIQQPFLYINKTDELTQRAMQCKHGGIRRLLLNILLHLPVREPINVEFLDFCLHKMLSLSETVSGQAVCMKLAYTICRREPELLDELQAYLENMEPEYYKAAVQCTRNHILKEIRKDK